jgi:predicted RNA-binding Zn-ribbon protein involved in translation (DUF1610 family)
MIFLTIKTNQLLDQCSKCGSTIGSAKTVAHLCSECGAGPREDLCCRIKMQ